MTPGRIQENWAPVSTRAGTFPTFKFKPTHNNVLGGTAAILRNAVNVPARGTGARRASARFPTGEPSGDYHVLHGQNVRNSNIFENGNSPGHSGTALGSESRPHSKWSRLAWPSLSLSTLKTSLRSDRRHYSIPFASGAFPIMPIK